jgi:hypothetical protein
MTLATLVYIYSLMATSLWAEDLETQYLRSLAHSQGQNEVERLQETYARLKVARTACRIEWQEHALPLSCYEALALDARRFSDAERVARLRKLDRRCALVSTNQSLLINVAPSEFLSAKCGAKVREAQDIRAYRNEDDDNEAIWPGD